MYREKTRKGAIAAILFASITLTLITAGCKTGGKPEETAVSAVYPSGTVKSAKLVDPAGQETAIVLEQKDLDHMLELIKKAAIKQDSTMNAKNKAELDITLTDSAIQLVRQDQTTLYYLYQSGDSGGVCYKIQSKELSAFLTLLFESFGATEMLGKKISIPA